MERKKLIIDTDCGSDDAMAIAMALRDPNYEILMFATVAGNVNAHQAALNTLTTIEYANTYEPPVYIGCTRALLKDMHFAYETHGNDGMGDLGYVPKRLKVTEGNGVLKILETLAKEPAQTVEIITLGTLTNIAMGIMLEPETMKRVKKITAMGTAGLGPGNVSQVAEFNIWQDAEAAKIVTDFGLPIMYVGWDACCDEAMLLEDDINRLKNSGEPGHFSIACNKCLYEMNLDRFGYPCLDMADPSAVAAALYPECIAVCDEYFCEVDISNGPSYGNMLIDKLHFSGKPKNAEICSKLHPDKYKEYIFRTLGA